MLFDMIFLAWFLLSLGWGVLYLVVSDETKPSPPPRSQKRGEFDPCPVTGLHSCPWHPSGGEHPGWAPR